MEKRSVGAGGGGRVKSQQYTPVSRAGGARSWRGAGTRSRSAPMPDPSPHLSPPPRREGSRPPDPRPLPTPVRPPAVLRLCAGPRAGAGSTRRSRSAPLPAPAGGTASPPVRGSPLPRRPRPGLRGGDASWELTVARIDRARRATEAELLDTRQRHEGDWITWLADTAALFERQRAAADLHVRALRAAVNEQVARLSERVRDLEVSNHELRLLYRDAQAQRVCQHCGMQARKSGAPMPPPPPLFIGMSPPPNGASPQEQPASPSPSACTEPQPRTTVPLPTRPSRLDTVAGGPPVLSGRRARKATPRRASSARRAPAPFSY